jgi:hypothetical protein
VGDLATADGETALDRFDLDYAGREVANHLTEDAAGHHDAPVGVAPDQRGGFSGVFQVGGGEAELLVEQLDQGAAEDGQRRSGGDRATHPGDRVSERVALSRELQGCRPPQACAVPGRSGWVGDAAPVRAWSWRG